MGRLEKAAGKSFFGKRCLNSETVSLFVFHERSRCLISFVEGIGKN